MSADVGDVCPLPSVGPGAECTATLHGLEKLENGQEYIRLKSSSVHVTAEAIYRRLGQ